MNLALITPQMVKSTCQDMLLRGKIEIDQVEVLVFISETQLITNVSHIKRMILNFSLFKYLNLS